MTPEPARLLSAEEARNLWPEGLRRSARTLMRWAANGTIPDRCVWRAGRSLAFREAALRDWLEGQQSARVVSLQRAG